MGCATYRSQQDQAHEGEHPKALPSSHGDDRTTDCGSPRPSSFSGRSQVSGVGHRITYLCRTRSNTGRSSPGRLRLSWKPGAHVDRPGVICLAFYVDALPSDEERHHAMGYYAGCLPFFDRTVNHHRFFPDFSLGVQVSGEISNARLANYGHSPGFRLLVCSQPSATAQVAGYAIRGVPN